MPSQFHRTGWRRALVGTLVASLGLGILSAAPAPADPAAPGHEQLEIAAERYNLARVQVDRATALLSKTESRIAQAEVRVKLVQTQARDRAAAMYRQSGTRAPLAIGDGPRIADSARRSRYLAAATAPDRRMLASLTRELAELERQRTEQRAARTLLAQRAGEAKLARRQLQGLIEAARVAGTIPGYGSRPSPAPPGGPLPEAPRGTPPGTPTTTRPSTTTTTTPVTPPTTKPPTGPEPPVSAKAATAIAYARAQLGKPYAFNTAGPTTFDCSGLTMAAWAAAGVRMQHYSGSQAYAFPKVTYSQLKPGDLVFFYADLHHVGIYIGDGQMIHAPQTGDVVKISSAWRDTFQWGVRPG